MASEWTTIISKMGRSLFTNDLYIFISFIITTYFLYKCFIYKKKIKKKFEKMPRNPDWAIDMHKDISLWYSIFLSLISIFPLLGMFGTVKSLISLDFTNVSAEIDNVKSNFFSALTSTAWGIFFSVVFKILNSILFYDIEYIYEKLDIVVKKNDKILNKQDRILEIEEEDDYDEE